MHPYFESGKNKHNYLPRLILIRVSLGMDEKHYKSTYNDINPNRCVFEKAINSRICNCKLSQRFNLADREGVACTSKINLERCSQLIDHLHNNARFVLQRLDVNKLGHAQERKIQNGGLLALQNQFFDEETAKVEDIDALITSAEKKFNSLKEFPYSEMVQVINAYRIRPKRVRHIDKKD